MSQVFIPAVAIASLLSLVPISKQVIASLYIGRWVRSHKKNLKTKKSENNCNPAHPVNGLYIPHKDWISTKGFYLWQRDRAISDAVHEGKEQTLGPELEEELNQLYLEVFLQKHIGKKQ